MAASIADQASPSESLAGQLLVAAAQAFASRGFDGTSIDDIADLRGSTKGLIYYHYRSKADLYLAVHLRALELCTSIVEETASASERESMTPDRTLFRLVYEHTKLLGRERDYAQIIVQVAMGGYPKALTDKQRRGARAGVEMGRRITAQYEAILESGIEEHVFRRVDTTRATTTILGAILWAAMMSRNDAGSAIDTMATELSQMILNSVVLRSPSA